MLMSLCPQVDPIAVVRAMVADVDLKKSPRYERLGHAVLDELETMELTGRTDWLANPPPPTSRKDAALAAICAAKAEVTLQLGLMPAPVTAAEVERRTGQAKRMHAHWPTGVAMRPATEAEILWFYEHSSRRGLAESRSCPTALNPRCGAVAAPSPRLGRSLSPRAASTSPAAEAFPATPSSGASCRLPPSGATPTRRCSPCRR
ncbi:hypothetical protein [Streptomyces sp. NPDC056632]|uniref:hypothetical protein n=1 Tax=Streptomyces sp. NPDC056632 TaxID=3345884 RepID=UPI0036C994F7